MADADNAVAPVNIQENVISASLNGSMTLNFLLGVYTMIYAGTMYLYTSRKRPNQRIVVSTITVLYILCFSDFIIQWFWLNQWMVVNGQTRDSIFLSTLDGPNPSLFVFDSFLYYGTFVVSDALLIWRCYHVWGMSLRVISAPLVTFLAELGKSIQFHTLFITAIALGVLTGPQASSETLSELYNNIITSLVLVSLGTTVITTSLIGYRIHSVARLRGTISKNTFQHIVVMIIESAAAYSVVLAIYAIFAVVPTFDRLNSPAFYAGDYIEIVANLTAGMAPTILIARIALTNTEVDHNTIAPLSMPHISALKFGSAGGSASDSESGGVGTASIQPADVVENDSEKKESTIPEGVVDISTSNTIPYH